VNANTGSRDRALSRGELRQEKLDRAAFLERPRRPITLVLDGITQNYNLGSIFRLCDAFLVERLIVCGAKVELHKRKLVQAGRGTQHWVPWQHAVDAAATVATMKERGAWIVVAEQTAASVRPEQLMPTFPATLVLGSERAGISRDVIEAAHAAVSIPMLGMGNSLNVATTAAILLYWLSLRLEAR